MLNKVAEEIAGVAQKHRLERSHLESQRDQLRQENIKVRKDLDAHIQHSNDQGFFTRLMTSITRCPGRRQSGGQGIQNPGMQSMDTMELPIDNQRLPISSFHDQREDL